MAITCRICGNSSDNRIHKTREMMFGTRDEFDYLECDRCGTLQIIDIPDLRKYYPENYLSFDTRVEMGETYGRRIAAKFAGRYFAAGNDPIGKLIVEKKPWIGDHYPPSLRQFDLGIDFGSRILDFGCGNGRLLQSLHYFGFRNLTGADAFIEKDIHYRTGVNILKSGLRELEPEFDLIMLHHSFEHLADPLESLKQVHRLLASAKFCLVRMPVKNLAWEQYGVNWVQLDPPRHLYIYTEESFRQLAKSAGFAVEKIIYDSTAFQFWGSEQYLLDIPLAASGSAAFTPPDVFSEQQIAEWTARAKDLNIDGRGDQACFYLRKL